MSSTKPPPPPAPRIRPYRRFLTSALHRRFVHASALSLLVCWHHAFWLGNKTSYFWSWFPFSRTGFRAVLLFLSCLAVFILHLASLHLGRRVAASPFSAFCRSILSVDAIQIAFWYLFSAWWFSETYIWSSSKADKLGWIIRGDISTPDRLNERPIYLRFVFLYLALCRTAIHLYTDCSSAHIPVSAPKTIPSSDHRTHKLPPATARIQAALPRLLQACAVTSALTALTGPFIYALFLRQTFWSWHLSFAKLVYSLSRSDARPTGYPPSNLPFMLHSFVVGFLLMFLWETTSFFFTNCLLQQPLKKDRPLSAGSKDPNGTLLNGLKSKRDLVKTFAFWELLLIAQTNPDRRKAIFADIDREDGQMWSQMLGAALDVVRSIDSRIEAATTAPKATEESLDPDAMEIDSLPRIAPPIKVGSIFADSPPPQTRTEEIEFVIDRGAKRIGQSKNPIYPPVSEFTKSLKSVKPSEGSSLEALYSRGLKESLWNLLEKSAIGWFFSTTFERRVNAVIIGSPHSNAAFLVDAIEATTRMLVASLSEDIYGKVIASVPIVVRTFTGTIRATENFVQQVKEEAVEETDIDEVETILSRLKASLAELLSAFQLYLTDVGLSAAEHKQAQNASRPARLLPERRERKKQPEPSRLQNGVVGKDAAPGKAAGTGNVQTAKGQGILAKETGSSKDHRGEPRRPQKRLEPQDPATRKNFFRDPAVPRVPGEEKEKGKGKATREMEMVR